jgi:hypothetical protein
MTIGGSLMDAAVTFEGRFEGSSGLESALFSISMPESVSAGRSIMTGYETRVDYMGAGPARLGAIEGRLGQPEN